MVGTGGGAATPVTVGAATSAFDAGAPVEVDGAGGATVMTTGTAEATGAAITTLPEVLLEDDIPAMGWRV